MGVPPYPQGSVWISACPHGYLKLLLRVNAHSTVPGGHPLRHPRRPSIVSNKFRLCCEAKNVHGEIRSNVFNALRQWKPLRVPILVPVIPRLVFLFKLQRFRVTFVYSWLPVRSNCQFTSAARNNLGILSYRFSDNNISTSRATNQENILISMEQPLWKSPPFYYFSIMLHTPLLYTEVLCMASWTVRNSWDQESWWNMKHAH